MQNNFPKIPLFLSLAFFGISLSLFFYFYREINSNNKESQNQNLQWQSQALKRDEIKTLDYSMKIIEKEKTQLETYFTQSSDIVPFLNTIEGLARQMGAKAEVVSVDILKDNNGLMVGMKISGTFNGLYNFLTLLENSPYELEFVSMDIRRETEPDVSSKNIIVPKWGGSLRIKLLSFIQ